ncbi:cyclin-dependent kinase G-2 isoform X1, partial [Tanacetum coccineum]
MTTIWSWGGYSKLPGVKASSFRYNLLWRKFPATSFTGSPNVSDAGFDLLNKLLTHNLEKRITADAALNHEWFREVPIPKSKDFMPTFPAQHAQDRRTRRDLHRALYEFIVSIGFAVEGQVKEKSKWFASLRDMARKLKTGDYTPNDTIWSGYSKLPGVKVNFVKHQLPALGDFLVWLLYNLLWRKFPATSFTGSPNVSDAGFDLLNKLLTHNPKMRITADATLNHEWFREVPLPKSKDFMPTRTRRVMKSPDPLEEQRRKELQHAEFRTGFDVEGQVKEKSKWFASLRDMERKLKLDLMAMEQSFLEANKIQEEVAQGHHKMQEMTKNYKSTSNFVKHQLPALGDFWYNLLWRKFPATSFTGSPNVTDAGFDLLNKLLTHDPEKWFRKVPLPKYKDFMPTFPAQHAQD